MRQRPEIKCSLDQHSTHDRRAILSEPADLHPVMRQHPLDLSPEARRMVHLPDMTEFMYYDIVAHIGRCQHKQAVEIQISLRAAAAPPCLLISDRYPSEGHSD